MERHRQLKLSRKEILLRFRRAAAAADQSAAERMFERWERTVGEVGGSRRRRGRQSGGEKGEGLRNQDI